MRNISTQNIVLLVFLLLSSCTVVCQKVTTEEGTYQIIDKEKRLFNILHKFPAYDSAAIQIPLLSNIENTFNKTNLEYTLYAPNDEASLHPMLIFMNGGGLISSNKDDSTIRLLGERLASEGIAFMAIDYRTDVLSLFSVNKAGYLAVQDFHAAVKFAAEISQKHKVSNDHLYIGGVGAGAVNALHTAALQEDEIGNTDFVLYDENLGCLDCVGNRRKKTSVRGVVNISGGIIDLKILEDEHFRLMQFYGENDNTISIDYDKPYPNILAQSKSYDVIENIVNWVYDFMEVPKLHGARSIQENKGKYPNIDIETIAFAGYQHELLKAKKGNAPMSSFNKISNEIIRFIRDDIRPRTPKIEVREKAEINERIKLKASKGEKYRWFANEELIHEGSKRRIRYAFSELGSKQIGLSIQNEFGVWSEVQLSNVEVVPHLSFFDRMQGMNGKLIFWSIIIFLLGLLAIYMNKPIKK